MSGIERPATPGEGRRIEAVDLLRGFVIILMVLDHTRDYVHPSGYGPDPLDPLTTTPLLYATRWVTHLCAPIFVFLAGASAWLQMNSGKAMPVLSRFLFQRGCWILALELTVIPFGWSFSVPFVWFLQVLWAIGWSMIGLAAAIRLPRAAILVLGLAIVAGHNLAANVQPEALGLFSYAWMFFFKGGLLQYHGEPRVLLLYPVLPWFGVILLGYAAGPILAARDRHRLHLSLGLGLIGTFLVLRLANVYGDPKPWTSMATARQTIMSFLDLEKYPPSLMFITATLGIAFLLYPLLERLPKAAAHVLLVFGSVPMFTYITHIYVMHGVAIFIRLLAGQSLDPMFDTIHDFLIAPDAIAGTGFGLPIVYLVWLSVIVLLYPLCRWFARIKRTRRDWWLSYL